jgi:hypothetical protein
MILNEIALHKPQSTQSKDPDSQIGNRATSDQTRVLMLQQKENVCGIYSRMQSVVSQDMFD